MNAVIKSLPSSGAAAALKDHRARMRELNRELEPLAGRQSGLQANLAAAVAERDQASAEVQSLQNMPTPDYPAIAAKEAEVRTLGVRIDRLSAAKADLDEQHRIVAQRLFLANQPLLSLMHAVACEQLAAVVERRRAIKQQLDQVEDEIEAFAHVADGIARQHQTLHPQSGALTDNLAGNLRALRERERSHSWRSGVTQDPARFQDRIAEIRRELDAE
jgi:chromosome segregation ATPase